MERLRGKLRGDLPGKITLAEKKRYEKLLRPVLNTKSRTLSVLIQEFEASAGSFDLFHSSMNGMEKILFKGYIDELRQENL